MLPPFSFVKRQFFFIAIKKQVVSERKGTFLPAPSNRDFLHPPKKENNVSSCSPSNKMLRKFYLVNFQCIDYGSLSSSIPRFKSS